MRHPESLLVPAMMFADYFLTVYGAEVADRAYRMHFKTEQYELNPAWQKAIAGKRYLDPRFVLVAIAFSTIVIVGTEIVADLPSFADFVLGICFGLYGIVIARHLSNILTFRRLVRRPDEVTGEVTMASTFTIALSIHQVAGLALPVAIFALFTRSMFAFGWLVGIAVLVHLHWNWLRRAESKPRPQPTDQATDLKE